MRKYIALAALLLLGSGVAWASGCPTIVSSTTPYVCTQTVFNDNGAAVTSGTIVLWDQDDTEFRDNGFPYVNSAATADSPYTAGVMLTESCPDQALCEIVTYGRAYVKADGANDAPTVDALVGQNATTAGAIGEYATGADTCALGTMLVEESSATTGAQSYVFVNIHCD